MWRATEIREAARDESGLPLIDAAPRALLLSAMVAIPIGLEVAVIRTTTARAVNSGLGLADTDGCDIVRS